MTTTNPVPAPTPAPAKKGGLGKIIRRSILVLFILIVIAVVVLYFSIDPLVKRAVVSSSTEATSLETTLDTASVSLMQGTLELAGLNMANAQGYKEPHFVTMNKCDVIVQGSSLFTDTVQVESINIDGLEITLEVSLGTGGLKSNLADVIQEITKKTAVAAGTAAPAAPASSSAAASPGKKLKIGTVSLSRTKVHIRISAGIPGLSPQSENMDLDLDPLVIKDPTNPDGQMEKIADLVGDILTHIAKQIMDNPKIKDELKNPMKGVMASLQGKFSKELGGLKNLPGGVKGLQDLGKNIPDIGKNIPDIGKNIPDIGKNLPDIGKGVGGLLNQKPPASQK